MDQRLSGRLSGGGRSLRPWPLVLAAGLALALAVGLVIVFVIRQTGSTTDVCNGAAGLCARRLDEVALATTHNAMNAADEGFLYPDQQSGIAAQLDAGVRGFLLDAYLGSALPVGDDTLVYTDLDQGRLQSSIKAVTSEEAARALELRERAGPPPDGAPTEVYLCHQFCELGAVPFADVVDQLHTFLEAHPDEVVVVVVQDELPAEELLPVLEDGGLDPYLATLDPEQPLPTLGAMVETGRRLVMGLENGDLGPQIPNVYDDGLLQEVPYDYSSVEQLVSDESCRRYRGHRDAPLFLLNHWVSPSSQEVAAEANAEDVLLPRADLCAGQRGQPVNLVAVDFFQTGDLIDVVGELNGRGTGSG